MVRDKYKFDFDGIDKTLSSLKAARLKYDDEVARFNNLAREISSSPSWKDIGVKTEFMNTFNAYISIYKKTCLNLEHYEKYLEEKSKNAKEIEHKYAR